MPHYRLWIRFRSHQWPLRDGDEIDVLTPTLELVATISASMLEALLAHHLDGLALTATLSTRLARAPLARLALPRKPLATVAKRAIEDETIRSQLRTRRRSRARANDHTP